MYSEMKRFPEVSAIECDHQKKHRQVQSKCKCECMSVSWAL
jgi:hypothetical protein